MFFLKKLIRFVEVHTRTQSIDLIESYAYGTSKDELCNKKKLTVLI